MPYRQWPARDRSSASESLFRPASTPEHYLVAHVDGGARGNPGPAGYGVVVEDSEAQPIAELSEFLGIQTNNYAEYNGLLAALDYAQRQPTRALRVLSDSELMVKQIKGQYKVSSPVLKDLYDRARKLIAQLDWFSIEHVRRERNREADALANEAMDRKRPGQVVRAAGEQKTIVSKTPASPSEPAPTPLGRSEGVVRNGRVDLDTPLPDGARVIVTVVG
jgi:ribonuclease HI